MITIDHITLTWRTAINSSKSIYLIIRSFERDLYSKTLQLEQGQTSMNFCFDNQVLKVSLKKIQDVVIQIWDYDQLLQIGTHSLTKLNVSNYKQYTGTVESFIDQNIAISINFKNIERDQVTNSKKDWKQTSYRKQVFKKIQKDRNNMLNYYKNQNSYNNKDLKLFQRHKDLYSSVGQYNTGSYGYGWLSPKNSMNLEHYRQSKYDKEMLMKYNRKKKMDMFVRQDKVKLKL